MAGRNSRLIAVVDRILLSVSTNAQTLFSRVLNTVAHHPIKSMFLNMFFVNGDGAANRVMLMDLNASPALGCSQRIVCLNAAKTVARTADGSFIGLAATNVRLGSSAAAVNFFPKLSTGEIRHLITITAKDNNGNLKLDFEVSDIQTPTPATEISSIGMSASATANIYGAGSDYTLSVIE